VAKTLEDAAQAPTTRRVVYIGSIPEGVHLVPIDQPSRLMKPNDPQDLPLALADEILANQPVNYKEA
jgi:hypothetical protein